MKALSDIWQVLKAIFTEWIPIIKNADLGPLGTLKDTWGIIVTVIGGIFLFIRFLKKKG